MVLGGIAACSDHNPTVVFTVDAAAGKSEAGASQDGGGRLDGGTAADAAVATDSGGPVVDVPSAVDLAPDANRIIDLANPLDGGVDRAADFGQAVDSSTAIDSIRTVIDSGGRALDGSGDSALDGGVDSSTVLDGGGTGG